MRGHLVPLVAGLLLAAGWSSAAASSPGVSVRASVGFSNLYRNGPQWVPVHARLRNGGSSILNGEVTVRGNTAASATYTQSVSLYPGTTKDVTLYVPATGVGNEVTIRYVVGNRTAAQATTYPEALPDTDLIVGALSDNAAAITWLNRAESAGSRLHVVSLSNATLPSEPEALASLDALILTNVDTSQLDSGQIAALRGYVQEGGALIEVGGADWQATLGGLPADLIPGRPAGLRILPSMPVARLLGLTTAPPGRLPAAPLTAARGVVLLSSHQQALMVKQPFADGLVEYLAFDPSQAPLAGWSRLGGLSTAILGDAMPQSIRRLTLDPADRASSYLFPGSQPMALGTELANVPAPAVAVLLGLIILVLAAVLLILTAIFVIRRVRPGLAPIAIPLAVLIAVGGLVRAAPAYAASRTIVNTLSFVRLVGHGPQYPANVYAGVITPLAGTYRLEYSGPALATNLSALYPGPYWDAGTTVSEGPSTGVDLGRVGFWGDRALSLRTTVRLDGGVATRLRLTRSGVITGRIYNQTDFVLREPLLIAGRSDVRLADIQPHASEAVTLVPSVDPQEHDYVPMLTRIYGRPLRAGNGLSAVSPFGNPSDMPREQSMSDRIRDAVDTLPETNLVSVLGEVMFVAWTDASLTPFTVNGSSVQQRNLTMLVKTVPPLSPPAGAFHVRYGTLGAQMLSVNPTPAPYTCCGATAQPISFGRGGSASFAFMLPQHLRLSSMRLDVYAGGSDPEASGYEGLSRGSVFAYDWRSGRWVTLHFHHGVAAVSHPNRLVSSAGALMLRLLATQAEMSILDAHQDLQLAVAGTRQ